MSGRWQFSAAALGVALLYAGPVVAAPIDVFAVLAWLQKPKTIRAEFTQVKMLKSFKRPQQASGTIFLARPRKLRLNYLAPYQTEMVVNGDRVSMSYPKLGRKQSFELTQDPTMQAVFEGIGLFVDADALAIQERYRVELDPQATTSTTVSLRFTPKNEPVAKSIRHILIAVAPDAGTIQQLSVVQTDGSQTVWRFLRVEVDAELDSSLFSP